MSLPPKAQACIDRLDALLEEARALGLDALAGEESYALRMTGQRYLPETLEAYARIPAALRSVPDDATGKTPDDQLLEQLTILERSVAKHVAHVAAHSRSQLSANGRFLIDRLGSLETLPQAPVQAETHASSLTSRRFVQTLTAGARRNRDLLEAAAEKLYAAFPLLTEVDRGLFGAGRAKRVAITVPIANDRLRYALALGPAEEVESTCAKIVRGVTLRTEQVPFEAWATALFEDLRIYARSSIQTQETLERMIR